MEKEIKDTVTRVRTVDSRPQVTSHDNLDHTLSTTVRRSGNFEVVEIMQLIVVL